MSTRARQAVEVAVIGAGVVGCAAALALARRGVAVALFEADREPGFGASGTNSGILHTGFDSVPGELETELILAAGALREPLLRVLEVPVLRCGAVMRAGDDPAQRAAVEALAEGARRNGVTVVEYGDGSMEVPGETVTDPVAYTLALAAEAGRQGADLRMGFAVAAVERNGGGLTVRAENGDAVSARLVVNCAGLQADSVARMFGDDSFSIYPRKGEFLVFEPPDGEPLERILLPVPTARTKGVLVFPTVDGKVIAGPTAVDQEDKHDWSVRAQAREEIISKAAPMYPPLEHADPIAAYAGLRPAGRGINYLIGPSRACPGLVNVAAIRSTGLTASLGIGQRVTEMIGSLGVRLGPERELVGGDRPQRDRPWWQRTASLRAAA